MRWPFVSLRAYEALESTLATERARYDGLAERYYALVTPARPVAPVASHMKTAAVDPVTEAIQHMAGTDTRLRGIMSQQVAQDRAAQMTEEEIVARIYNGERDDIVREIEG